MKIDELHDKLETLFNNSEILTWSEIEELYDAFANTSFIGRRDIVEDTKIIEDSICLYSAMLFPSCKKIGIDSRYYDLVPFVERKNYLWYEMCARDYDEYLYPIEELILSDYPGYNNISDLSELTQRMIYLYSGIILAFCIIHNQKNRLESVPIRLAQYYGVGCNFNMKTLFMGIVMGIEEYKSQIFNFVGKDFMAYILDQPSKISNDVIQHIKSSIL